MSNYDYDDEQETAESLRQDLIDLLESCEPYEIDADEARIALDNFLSAAQAEWEDRDQHPENYTDEDE